MSAVDDSVVRNRALQTEWYGEPLGDRFRRLLELLGLPQSGLARVLGLSPPMLSQLMSGQRAKISNPAVLNRLLALEELARDPALATLPAAEVGARIDRIRAESPTTSSGIRVADRPETGHPETGHQGQAHEAVRTIQSLLRAVASAAEIEAAAALLDHDYPDLSRLLRVYGNGRTSEAEAHLARALGLRR